MTTLAASDRLPELVVSSPAVVPDIALRVLILSTTGFTLLFAAWLMFGILAGPIKKELLIDPVGFSWVVATAVLAGSLLRLPAGMLADRIGGRSVFLFLLLWSAGACVVTAFVDSYAMLLLCAGLVGVAGNAFSVGVAWNSAWQPKAQQGLALGVFGAGNVGASVTKLIAPAVLASIPAAGFLGGLIPGNWRAIPVVYAVILLAMAMAVWWLTPSEDRRPAQGRSLAAQLAPLRFLRVHRFSLEYVAVFGAYVALSFCLPGIYMEAYGVELATAALLTCLFIFPASLLRPLGGWLSDRFGPRLVMWAVLALMIAATIPLCIPALTAGLGVAGFTALVVTIGIGMGLGKAAVFTAIPRSFSSDVGAVGGLVGCLGALGGFILPPAFAYLKASTGLFETAWMVMLALFIACAVWMAIDSETEAVK